MLISRKAIGPVIASVLFLVVAVISVISFQTWYADYGSQLFVDIEQRSAESVSNTKIEAILGTTLYFKNGFNSNLSITDIKVDGNSCSVITNISNGIAEIILGNNCTNNLTTKTPEVVVYTKNGIYSAYVWYKNATITSESLSENLSEVLSSGSSFQWYNYTINNSLRFNDDDSAYLSRTPSVAGNRTTWTWSGWVKRGDIGLNVDYDSLFGAHNSGSGGQTDLRFQQDTDKIRFYSHNDAATLTLLDLQTTEVFRDPSDWTQIILSVDTTQATANNRIKLYVNGKQITSFSTETYPTQNSNLYVGNTANIHYIGSLLNQYFDGYLSEVNFIDGQALNASYFGEFNLAGKWTPKQYNGTYGTNGFYLPFNNTNILGEDAQTNPTGISVLPIEGGVLGGNMTSYGANSVADDGNTVGDWSTNTIVGTGSVIKAVYGKNFKTPTKIRGFKVWGSTSRGYEINDVSSAPAMTIEIYGSNEGFQTNGTLLGTHSFTDVTSGQSPQEKILSTVSNEYSYVWLEMYRDDLAARGFAFAEVQFYTNGPNDWTANNLDETGGLLIHSNVTSNYSQTQFKDESGNGHTITTNGNTLHSLKTSAVDDNSAIYFDGSSSFFELPIHTDLYFNSSENFTLDFWAKYISGEGGINIGNYQDSVCQGLLAIQINSGEFHLNPNGPTCGYTYNTINGADATADWTHYAYVKAGTNYSLYINGVSQGSFTFSGPLNTPNLLWVGKRTMGAGNAQYWTGFMDEIRISKEARWTSEFTPDTTPYAIDSNTKLLIHSDYNEILDSGEHKHQITINGDAKHSIDTSKFGTSSLYFDGTGDYLTMTGPMQINTNDFTVDFWTKLDGDQTDKGLISFGTTGTDNGFRILLGSVTNELIISTGNSAIIGTSDHSSPLTNNIWHHIALTRTDSTLNLFLDGTLIVTKTDNYNYNSITNWWVGQDGVGAALPFKGYLDEIRITKGKALWTSNFTPPTSPANRIESYSTDVMIDTPTNNFATLNPLNKAISMTSPSNGNLKPGGNPANSGYYTIMSSLSSIDKFYYEIKFNSIGTNAHTYLGFIPSTHSAVLNSPNVNYPGEGLGWFISPWNAPNGLDLALHNLTAITYPDSIHTDTSTWMFTVDPINGNAWFGIDGTWYNSGNPYNGTNPTWTNLPESISAAYSTYYAASNSDLEFNFGQGGQSGVQWCENASGYFKYCPPNGFKALSTNNLPSPTINISKQFFDVLTYTGDGTEKNITGLNFTPDLVWGKSRNTATSHLLFDSLRGPNNYLSSDSVSAEGNDGITTGITAFINGGFTHGADVGGYLNYATRNYVIWNWKKSSGAGIDIVKDTSISPSKTINHSLNTTPDFIIGKRTDTGGDEWVVYHSSLGFGGNLLLSTTAAFDTPTAYSFATADNYSFTLGSGAQFTGTYIFYLFAEKEGFSKFGTYTGNNLLDGPFIYTGFKPAFIMIKRTDGGLESWTMYDNKRLGYNPYTYTLYANTGGAEDTTLPGTNSNGLGDMLSNGFKIRSNGGSTNTAGATYIYLAFAEYPFR